MREPGDSRPPIPMQSTVAVTGGDRPPAALKAPVPGLAEAPVAETPAAVSGGDRRAALPAQIAVPDRAAPSGNHDSNRPRHWFSGGVRAQFRRYAGGAAPVAPESDDARWSNSGSANPPATSPETTATPSPVTSRALSGAEAPAPSLEDLLVDRSPPPASLRQPSPIAPPVGAEPDPGELWQPTNQAVRRRAATGEITVALLWNSPGDA